MRAIYTSIPTLLCKYALTNRKVNHLKLYVYFKQIASGHVKYSNDNIKSWANDINLSERWVKDALRWMIQNGWITVNTKRNSYRVVSYEQLCRKLEINSKSAAIYELEDFSKFKEFCCAVVITYCLKYKIFLDKKKNQSVSSLTDPSMSWYFYSKGYYALPINYLGKFLEVSSSTANNFKQLAIRCNFISVKKHFKPLLGSDGSKLGVEHLQSFKKTFPRIAGRVRSNGSFLSIVDADIIKSEVYTKRKRYKY